MSLASLPSLRKLPADREIALLNGMLVYPAFFHEPPGEKDEFIMLTALDLRFFRKFLDAYPEQSSAEYEALARGELVPNMGQLVAVLEHVDACIKNRYPHDPWSRYPEAEPSGEVAVWVYDENGPDIPLAGYFASRPEAEGLTPYPFHDEGGQAIFASHWALRMPGEVAPVPPPIL